MKNSITAILSVLFVAINASSACADGLSDKVSNTTDYGDGIKISDYSDKSGFEAEGGGGFFTYDVSTKTMTLTTSTGIIQRSFVGETVVNDQAIKTAQSRPGK